jgi:hypothetical protein
MCHKTIIGDKIMKHPNVVHAIERLLDELNSALKSTRQEAAAASNEGDYDKAEALLRVARQIERFIAKVQAIQREWDAIGDNASRRNAPVTGQVPRGERMPQEAYRLSILRALVAMGGGGRVDDVLERVYQELKPHLKPVDLEPLSSGSLEPRWRNSARWERHHMAV